jgi:hypothetical protein
VPSSIVSPLGRAARIVGAAALLIAAGVAVATPAQAAATGYVRLAHLSPDTPEVDVYLSSQTGAVAEQVFPGVGYGVLSAYLPLPAGGYTVSMRPSGAPKSQPPVLTTQVSVTAGGAYTVAGVGRYADLGLRVLADDLALPAGGQAKVRIIQASVQRPLLGVTLPDGTPIAQNVAFATTTAYQLVRPGEWRLVISPADGRAPTGVQARLGAGNVYSLLVLDGATGLKTEVRTDATRDGGVPTGGVETGAGGTAGAPGWLPLTGAGLLALIAAGAVWGMRRRSARVW